MLLASRPPRRWSHAAGGRQVSIAYNSGGPRACRYHLARVGPAARRLHANFISLDQRPLGIRVDMSSMLRGALGCSSLADGSQIHSGARPSTAPRPRSSIDTMSGALNPGPKPLGESARHRPKTVF
jgi:hypothetical protein